MCSVAYSLVATDLDGTFLSPDAADPDGPEVPSGPNKAAFRAVDAIGVPVVTISGRCYATTSTMLDATGVDGYVVSFHGAITFGPKKGRAERPVLYSNPMPPATYLAAIDLAKLRGTMISVYTPNGIWAGGDYDFTRANAAHGTEAAWWARVGEFPMPFAGLPAFEALGPADKALVLASSLTPNSKYFREHDALKDELERACPIVLKVVIMTTLDACDVDLAGLKARIPATEGHVIGPFGTYNEVIAANTNKARALKKLVAGMGCTMDNVVSFGDSYNDLEMIAESGHGVAVANAVDAVKAVAAKVSDKTNVEHAVAHELNLLLDAGMLTAPASQP